MVKKIFTTQSCLIIVCVVLLSLTVPAGAYAGGKAQCPCFKAQDLKDYAPAGSAVTTSRYVENTGTYPTSGYVVTRSDVDGYEVDACLEAYGNYVSYFNYNYDSQFEEWMPEATYGFSVIASADGSGTCSAVYSDPDSGSGDPVYISEQTSSAQSAACIDLLDQARDNDLAAMTTISVGGGDKGPDR